MYKIIGGDDHEYGPVSADTLRQWIAEGRANARTRALPEGAADWKTLAELPEFAAALGAASAPSPASPAPGLTPAVSKTNSLAVTGILLGALSMTFGLCCCGGMPLGVAGAICSGVALSQISRNPEQQGRGLAIAGLVLSMAGLLLSALFYLLGFALGGPRHWKAWPW